MDGESKRDVTITQDNDVVLSFVVFYLSFTYSQKIVNNRPFC